MPTNSSKMKCIVIIQIILLSILPIIEANCQKRDVPLFTVGNWNKDSVKISSGYMKVTDFKTKKIIFDGYKDAEIIIIKSKSGLNIGSDICLKISTYYENCIYPKSVKYKKEQDDESQTLYRDELEYDLDTGDIQGYLVGTLKLIFMKGNKPSLIKLFLAFKNNANKNVTLSFEMSYIIFE